VRPVDTGTAAASAGVNVRTIRRWVERGDLANVGSGKGILVDLDAVSELLARRMYARVAGRT
jgi:excisionase family DNA binding protein